MTNTKKPEEYVIKLANALQLGWELAGERRPAAVAEWNKINRSRLPFREFQVGSRFFLKHTPVYIAKKERNPARDFNAPVTTPSGKVVSAALQHRWTGPYKVTKKFSPVLYETIVNGDIRVVHALHMKHDPLGETFRAGIPLPVQAPTPMKSFLDRETESPKSTEQLADDRNTRDESNFVTESDIPEEYDDIKFA
jgi:hypothetical protein